VTVRVGVVVFVRSHLAVFYYNGYRIRILDVHNHVVAGAGGCWGNQSRVASIPFTINTINDCPWSLKL
jgi:hypothetical protein